MQTSLSWLNRLQSSGAAADWEQLAARYRPLLSGWISRAGVPQSDQDDLIQSVMMVVVRRLPDFEHRHVGAFRGWLRSILANVLSEYFRRHQSTTPQVPINTLVDPQSDLSKLLDHEHDLFITTHVLRIARGDFRESTWQAFELQVIHNRTARETAAELSITPNAAIKAKSRVLARLREELQFLLRGQ